MMPMASMLSLMASAISHRLAIEVSKYQILKQRLLASYPNCDDESLTDTLEGITDLHEMIAAVIRSALVDEALRAGLRFRLDDMRERLSRLEIRASKKRQLALEAMTRWGLASSSSPILPPRPGRARQLSWSSLRIESQKPIGSRNHPSSIGKRFSASSSVAARSPVRN